MATNPDSEAGYAQEDPPLPPNTAEMGSAGYVQPDDNLETPPHQHPLYQIDGESGKVSRIDEPIKVSVSATQKVNTGNYESVDVFFSLSNVPVGATDEDLAAAMATSELVFTHVKAKVSEKVAAIRRNVG